LTVEELHGILEELINEEKGDMPLVVATQRSYPLRLKLEGVNIDDDDEIFIAADGHPETGSPYAPNVWDNLITMC
jgi:hypothetical protein